MSQAVLDAYAAALSPDPGLRNHLTEYQSRQVPPVSSPVLEQARQFPVVLGLLISLLLAGLYTGFGSALSVRQFVMVDFFEFSPDQLGTPLWAELMQTLQQAVVASDFTCLVTLGRHIHFLFNALGALILAARSLRREPIGLLSLVIASALISNLAQFAVSGPSFGGFSGVVYHIDWCSPDQPSGARPERAAMDAFYANWTGSFRATDRSQQRID